MSDWSGWVLAQTGARALTEIIPLQRLWGGYGHLLRLGLDGAAWPSVILKQVEPPPGRDSLSDRRKVRSYEVERSWYLGPARQCEESCRVARCLGADDSRLLLEDLEQAGYRPGTPRLEDGLRWLASFHARFLGQSPEGLWDQGTYWHLATRPDEWQRLPDGPLKAAAATLDARLRSTRFPTLVHGDAKPSNFCWGEPGGAAVDFQYVGPGCGIRDVAYFMDCCLGEVGCLQQSDTWLDFYFDRLRQALGNPDFFPELESEWRGLFCVAWSDFCRFEQGWRGPAPLGPFTLEQLRLALG